MTNLRYAIYPGYIISKTDGQEHYITSKQLIGLYQVDPKECIIVPNSLNMGEKKVLNRKIDELKLVKLYPKFKGDYNVKQ